MGQLRWSCQGRMEGVSFAYAALILLLLPSRLSYPRACVQSAECHPLAAPPCAEAHGLGSGRETKGSSPLRLALAASFLPPDEDCSLHRQPRSPSSHRTDQHGGLQRLTSGSSEEPSGDKGSTAGLWSIIIIVSSSSRLFLVHPSLSTRLPLLPAHLPPSQSHPAASSRR